MTTALPPIVMSFGTMCVTPSPAHVSLAVMFAECVTFVPFAWPHGGAACVTVTVAAPLFVGSSLLVAVIVYVPGVVAVNAAVRPLGVNVAPLEGAAFHVTPPVHEAVTLRVAVSVAATPVFTVAGLALALTLVTVHLGGVTLALPVGAL
ncbi:MAG: hypothetical protein ACREPM_20095 [Gemmatimonadaceae bacterium]